MAGDPPDVLIAPKVGPVGWFDFHRAADTIELGAQATEKVLPEIEETVAALSTPPVPANTPPK
jgi:NTE family protein